MFPWFRGWWAGWLIVAIAACPSGAGDAPPPKRMRVPGTYVPKDGKLVWRASYDAAAKPGWAWVPAGWVRLTKGWGYQPGYWQRADEPVEVGVGVELEVGGPTEREPVVHLTPFTGEVHDQRAHGAAP